MFSKTHRYFRDIIAIVLGSLGFTASIIFMGIDLSNGEILKGIISEFLVMLYCLLCGVLFYKRDQTLMLLFRYPLALALIESAIILGSTSIYVGGGELIAVIALAIYHRYHTYKQGYTC